MAESTTFRAEAFGDRINLHRNQIATFEFWEKHLEQLYGYKADIVGGLLGECEGILGAKPHTWDGELQLLRFNDMVLVAGRNESAGTVQPHGGVYLYKKTDQHQLSTFVELSTYEGSSGVVWFSIFSVPTDHGQFLKWKPGFAKGRVVAEKRLRRARAVFATSANWNSPPATGGPWFKLASFTYPEDGVPTVKWVSAWDQGSHLGPTSRSNPSNRLGLFMQAAQETYPAAPKSFGTARAISLLAHFICAQQSNTYSFDPGTGEVLNTGFGALNLDPSYRGRVELHNDLFAAEGAIEALETGLSEAQAEIVTLQGRCTTLESQVAQLLARPTVLWAADIAIDGTIEREHGAILIAGPVTVTRSPTGTYNILLSAAPVGDAIATVTLRTVDLKGSRTQDISWINPGEVRVRCWNELGVLSNTAFSIQVSGRLT